MNEPVVYEILQYRIKNGKRYMMNQTWPSHILVRNQTLKDVDPKAIDYVRCTITFQVEDGKAEYFLREYSIPMMGWKADLLTAECEIKD